MNDFWRERFRQLDALIERIRDDASGWKAARELADDSLHRLHAPGHPQEGWVEPAKEYFARAVAFADQRNAGEFADAVGKARNVIP